MVGNSPLMTETMTGMVVTVQFNGKVPGGMISAMAQTSMDCTSVGLMTPEVQHGALSTRVLFITQ